VTVHGLGYDSVYRLSEENITFVFRAEIIQIDTTEDTAVLCSEGFKFPFKDMKYYTVCECEHIVFVFVRILLFIHEEML
jgi:hypothetical protein